MKVRLLVPRATLQGPQAAGDEIEVGAEEARRMIAAGQARPVRSRRPETAVPKATAEKAAR